MRVLIILLTASLLVSCRSHAAAHARASEPASSGWSYRPGEGVPLSYVSPDGAIKLAGWCEGGPAYLLKGGDYKHARDFVLTVDGKSWTLPVTRHAHGRYLRVGPNDASATIARAKELIAFQVGNWRREIKPSPQIAEFAKTCR